jgi:DNA integrity scanning protein DisA with diadenylate cyclase activity
MLCESLIHTKKRKNVNIQALAPFIRDGIEILFFSSLFYIIALWLKKDRTHNLLPYFYGYLLVSLSSYYCELATLNMILLLFAPCLVMFFALVHQETLQRNLVALKNVRQHETLSTDWISTLLQSSLIAMNDHKELRCIIEYTDRMAELITSSYSINAPITPELLSLLLQSPVYKSNHMIWVTSTGNLVAVNAQWYKSRIIGAIDTLENSADVWHHDALLYTAKTDALILWTNPTTGLFTIVSHGVEHTGLSTSHALQLIAHHCKLPITAQTTLKKEISYGITNRSQTHEQHSS